VAVSISRRERHVLRSLFLCVLCLLLDPARARAQGEAGGDLPEHHAADAGAEPVTARNLLANERFWPYQVGLAKAWKPPGRAEPLPSDIPGVLIRVEASGVARIDFGRDGLYEVPVDATDLVELANRVRRGELEKMAPNFVLDIGPRLADSAADSLRAFGLRATAERRAFLCVFADPAAQGFSELAAALAPLKDRQGLLTILFAQGDHPDTPLRERLRSLAWPIPFVFDHLSEPYTHSLLPEDTAPPALLLVSREGRVLFESPWRQGVTTALDEALEQAGLTSESARAQVR
jgi:hypothetical protein